MTISKRILIDGFLILALVFCGCAADETSRDASGELGESPLIFDSRPLDIEGSAEVTEKEMQGRDIDSESDLVASSVGGPHLEWFTAVVEEVEEGGAMKMTLLDSQSSDKTTVRVEAAAWVNSNVLDQIYPGAEVRISFVTSFHQPIPSEVIAYDLEIVAA